jgi:hypothetical protein
MRSVRRRRSESSTARTTWKRAARAPRALEPLAEHALGQPVLTVDVGGVDEVDARVESGVEDGEGGLPIAADAVHEGGLVGLAEGHGPEAQLGDPEPALAEVAVRVLHDRVLRDEARADGEHEAIVVGLDPESVNAARTRRARRQARCIAIAPGPARATTPSSHTPPRDDRASRGGARSRLAAPRDHG